jgi:hypothetical protein
MLLSFGTAVILFLLGVIIEGFSHFFEMMFLR